MSKNLKWIVPIGVVAIGATYYLSYPPQDKSAESSADAAYEQQLAEARQKQADKSDGSTIANENANTKADAAPGASATSSDTTVTSSSTSVSSTSTPSSSTTTITSTSAKPTIKVNGVPISTSTTSSPSIPTSATQSPQISQSEHVTQHIQNTLKSLQNMMPSAASSKLPIANYDSNAGRLQYLQTMPVSIIEATRKQDAMVMARQDAGRANPFEALPGGRQFPRQKTTSDSATSSKGRGTKGALMGSGPDELPLPPLSSNMPSLATDVAPPPPLPGISLEELPPPPDRPLLSKRLKLNAIVGDHVILAFKDRRFQKKNRYKQYITLSQGQEFDTVTLIDIGKDRAVLEEHGKQITMELDPIR